MSQSIFADINPSSTSGNQLATYLNDFKAAMLSGLSGTSRPAELEAGGYWIDITSDPVWTYNLWTGTLDVPVFTIDTTSGTAGGTGANDLFTVAKTSADTASPIIQLLKKRLINNGQVLAGDYIGTIEFKGNANDLSVPITVRMRAVATNNYTAGSSGTDLIFEATSLGSNTIAEVMRIKNGRLGVGTNSPTETIHALGNGIRSEKASDDAVGAKFIARKRRVTGAGQVQAADVIAQYEMNSTDDAGTEVLAAKIVVSAVENHTTTAQGTSISVQVKKTGETTFTEQLLIGNEITVKAPVNVPQVVDSSTAGSGQSIAPTKSIVKVTNASLVSINNIANPVDGKLLILMNGTGAPVTITNNAGGTAANRILTGTGGDLTLKSDASLWLAYDAAESRWKVVGGSGGGDILLGTALALTGGGSIAISLVSPSQSIRVAGASGPVDLSTTIPFGSSAPQDGSYIELIGDDDTNTVKVFNSDTAKGCVGNFNDIEIAKYQVVKFRYVASVDRYILV